MASPPDLDPSQEAAVKAADAALVIAAGPGTGKTRVFSHRVAHLIKERGVAPESILAVTFTRSAAAEMRHRIQALLGGAADRLWIETCHAAALRILRAERYPFGPDGFSVLDEAAKPALLDGIVSKSEASAVLQEVRLAKQALQAPASPPAQAYGQRLRERRLLDFDDLFPCVLRLLEEKPAARELWSRRFRHVVVDEFQDTSLAQYAFVKALAAHSLCVIGDPDQSIYGFAGVPFDPFARFRQDHPDHRVLPLTENYRSQAVILDAAKQVIARNGARIPRQLRARLERGLPIDISGHQSDRQEAAMAVRRIEGLLGGASQFTVDSAWAPKDSDCGEYSLGDIAILFRLNAQARLFEEALERAGLPYITYGKKTKKDGQEITLGEDLEDFQQNEAAAPLPHQPVGEAITLMTLHRAKGLEFPVVFLTGCEDGILPYRRDGSGPGLVEEERRLFYVGMTRAQRRLFLSYAHKRFLFGRTLDREPSPYVEDIEEELRRIQANDAPKRRRPPPGKQPELF
ncbi:MAG: UvrD-helicase domain-containing protein [Elusimicrobiota bacterium]